MVCTEGLDMIVEKKPLIKRLFARFDFILFFVLFLITLYGIAVIHGAVYNVPGLSQYSEKQLMWFLAALPIFLIISLLDYQWIRHLCWPVYLISIIVLALLIFYGHKVKGARSWYAIGSHRIQPSEFAKITVTICLAHFLAWKEKPVTKLWDMLAPTTIVGLPVFLILSQPDFGTAALFFPLFFVMLYASGASRRLLLLCVLLTIWGAMLAYPLLKPYQKARIKVFINPEHDTKWQGYNIRQAEISLGSGGIYGKGWKQGTQTTLGFLPERHTDFIFSTLGEQFGFVGCGVLILLYALAVWRAGRIALQSQDKFGRLLVTGLISLFLIHIFFNIGMTLRFLPVTGLPLPLFSYGGSFLLTNFIMFGIVQSVGVKKANF